MAGRYSSCFHFDAVNTLVEHCTFDVLHGFCPTFVDTQMGVCMFVVYLLKIKGSIFRHCGFNKGSIKITVGDHCLWHDVALCPKTIASTRISLSSENKNMVQLHSRYYREHAWYNRSYLQNKSFLI